MKHMEMVKHILGLSEKGNRMKRISFVNKETSCVKIPTKSSSDFDK